MNQPVTRDLSVDIRCAAALLISAPATLWIDLLGERKRKQWVLQQKSQQAQHVFYQID
jgi:hypothetical protein